MTIVLFLLVLSVLVFVHELGHFLAAKKSGIRVDEFAIGFPPRIWAWRRGETDYALNLIPFGGYVKIFGETPDEESLSGPDAKRSMVNMPKYTQAIVLIAGIVFNLVFAWLLFAVGFMIGTPTIIDGSATDRFVRDAQPVIIEVLADSPAAEAGLLPQEVVSSIEVAGQTVSGTDIDTTAVRTLIDDNPGQPVVFTVERQEGLVEVEALPAEGIVEGGVALGLAVEQFGTLRLPVHKALGHGALQMGDMSVRMTKAFLGLISDAFTGQAKISNLTGPVGLAGLVGEASRVGFSYLLSFTAFISINLAILNLFPFPALDGGRLLFLLIETIKGSRIKPKIANTVNLVGFGLLMLLMLVITYHDIVKLL